MPFSIISAGSSFVVVVFIEKTSCAYCRLDIEPHTQHRGYNCSVHNDGVISGLLGTCESAAKPCGARVCGSSNAFHGVQEAGSSNLLTQTSKRLKNRFFFVFYGQFTSQYLCCSTLLALSAPFSASCVHVCHFEFHCHSAYLHCFHPDNSASVLLFLSVSRFSLAMYHFSRKTQQPVSIRNSLIATDCRLLCIKISK